MPNEDKPDFAKGREGDRGGMGDCRIWLQFGDGRWMNEGLEG